MKKVNKDNIIKESYNSTNLKSSTYDVENKELIVEFKKGGKYSYSNVPLQTFISLGKSSSKGKYFSKNIAKNYRYKKIS
mgnify:FL=1|tara:strand:+ start:549 stop:785 length:237 start_codon:yes stop_codon:yes gene_type:complete